MTKLYEMKNGRIEINIQTLIDNPSLTKELETISSIDNWKETAIKLGNQCSALSQDNKRLKWELVDMAKHAREYRSQLKTKEVKTIDKQRDEISNLLDYINALKEQTQSLIDSSNISITDELKEVLTNVPKP